MQLIIVPIFYIAVISSLFAKLTDDECLNHIFSTNDQLDTLLPNNNKSESFGRNFRKYFQLEDGYTNLNHGGFGASPKVVGLCAQYWRKRMEANPDRWYRYELKSKLDVVLKSMASYMGVEDYEDLLLVPNVSAAYGAILGSIGLKPDDVIVYFSEAFGTVAYAINHYAKKSGSKIERIELRFPVQDDFVVSMLEKVMQKNRGRVRLVSISHISSTPSVLLPVQAIQNVCRRNKALLIVDGAHALGQIDLNLGHLNPDIYVANGHKWFFSSRGSGLVYVKKNVKKLIQFSSIPHYFPGKNSFFTDESNVYDFSPLLTMLTALEFRRLVGGEWKIAQYNRKLASKAAGLLMRKWKTKILIPDYGGQNLSMINVGLPLYHHMLVKTVVERLMLQQRTFLIYFYHAGNYHVRISAQIYNEESDFEDLAQILLDVKRDLKPLIATSFPCP